MNTCDSCNHWKKINDAHYCQCKSLIEGEMFQDDEDTDSSLVYLYYEGAGDMAFKTGQKFGCVHHRQITKDYEVIYTKDFIKTYVPDGLIHLPNTPIPTKGKL